MNGILNVILCIVALLLMGGFAAFLVLLNWIKQEERKKDMETNGKISR